MSTEWYPGAVQVSIPITNFVIGHDTRLAVCLHIVNGSIGSCINWFKDPAAGVSSHFGIGKTGSVYQFVSMNHSANAQGLHYDGQWYTSRPGEGRVNVRPTWTLLTPGMKINPHVISIEHEGKPGEPLTPAMKAAQTALLRWLAVQTGLVYVAGSTLIGHSMLDNVSRSYCPGSAFDLPAIAAAANAPAEPDWRELWGSLYPYRETWGIPQRWRQSYKERLPLGKAISDEMAAAANITVQAFERGYVTYHPTAGTKVNLW